MTPRITASDFLHQAPLLILVLTGLLLILAEAFTKGRQRSFLMRLAVAGCALAAIAAIWEYKAVEGGTRQLMATAHVKGTWYGMLVPDRFSCFFIVLFPVMTAFTAMVASGHQREYKWENGEFYGLLLLSASGLAMLAMANDMVTIFLGIECMSISVYALTASRWRSRRGAEAAMKYFLMGAFASGFMLYGIALIYGATGYTNLSAIKAVADPASPLLLLGMFMMLIAFAFKVAAVPFHMWAPDAYEGAPTPVTGFMAAAVKAGAFVAILRVFSDTLGGEVLPLGRLGWAGTMAVLAVITMTVGNIAALRQENIKRMLAYSSISHAGVLLVGIVTTGLVSTSVGQPAVMFYLVTYSVTTMGAFAVVAWIGSRGKERVLISDWNGLAAQRPGAALAMTIFMLSLGGIPPTAGFVAKFYIFQGAMQAADTQLLWLVIIGVLNSAISIFYYLRVVVAMYFKPAEEEFKPLRAGAVAFVFVVCALAVMKMGVWPGWWLAKAGG